MFKIFVFFEEVLRIPEIEWKYRVSQMKVIYNRYENLFTSARKLANLIEKDNENVYRREKYGSV